MITQTNREEFQVFSSWRNLKTFYGASGNGTADDTVAFQNALNDIGVSYFVLYIPAGQYRITSRLQRYAVEHCCVFGEDPATTRVFWDGAVGGRMFQMDGFSYYQFARIHWDGRGIADDGLCHEWDGSTGTADTYNEHSDEWFTNFKHWGLKGGTPNNMDAETTVKRCVFINNYRGLAIYSYNALDWWVWDCYFENNIVGITNDEGGGNFHAHRCIFKKQVLADILLVYAQFFSFRDNYSIGSNRFVDSLSIQNNSSLITLQRNTIIDCESQLAVKIKNTGPLIMIDNIIRSRPDHTSGPVAYCDSDIFALGNTVTTTGSNFSTWFGRVIEYDTTVVSRAASINATEPSLSPIPRKVSRPVIEVSTTNTDASITDAIIQATALNGQKPIIHFASGNYTTTQNVLIPAGTDMQIVGDGLSSKITSIANRVFYFIDGRNNSLKSLYITGGGTGVYVRHRNAKMLFGRGLSVGNCSEEGLFYDVANTNQVELHDFNHASNDTGVRASGPGNLNIMSGSSSNNQQSYDVINGASILAQDIWYEGYVARNFLNLTGSGKFTLSGSKIYTEGATNPIIIDDFDGNVVFIGVEIQKHITVKGTHPNTKVLGMGLLFDNQYPGGEWIDNTATNATVQTLLPQGFSGGSYQIEQVDVPNEAFIKEMLTHIRTTQHQYRSRPVGFFMHRLFISNCKKGIHIKGV